MNAMTRLEDLGVPPVPGDDVDLGRLLRLLWRQRWVIAGVTALALITAIFILSQITPIYTATTKVMIDGRRSSFLSGRDPLDAPPIDMAVVSEVEVMYSRNIAKRVADKLDLYDDKRFNPAPARNRLLSILDMLGDEVGGLFSAREKTPDLSPGERERRRRDAVVDSVLGALTADPIPQSMVIRIRMRSPDPALAATLADAYANAYIDEQLESKFQSVRYISTWLNGRLESLRTAVVDSERAVAAYRSENGLLDGPGRSGNQQQLSELNSQLVAAQARRAETEARLSRVEAALQSDHAADLMTDLLDSPLIQRLKEQEATLARSVTELRARYGERHPEMVKAQSELTQVQRQLNGEVQNVVKTLRNDFAVQRQREASITAQIRAVEGSVLSQNKAEIKLRELEREAQANRTLYETFLSKFKETGEQELIKQADARIIAPADVPDAPSYPRQRLVLLAAGVLGLLGGVALVLILEQLDRTIRTREQLEDLLGLPTFSLIPQLKAGTEESVVHNHVTSNPSSSYTESMRMAWVGLQHNGGGSRIIVVTSSVPEEGKSLTSLSLARVVASLGLRVVLIDADLRRASLADKTGLKPVHTLADVIRGRMPLEQAMLRDPQAPVDMLLGRPAGHKDVNLLAATDKVVDLFADLRERYDVVIVDSPPALAIADVQVLARLADQTLFCVRWDNTPRETVLSAIRALRDARAKISGTLLTRVNIRKHAQYGYHDVGYYYARYRNYYSEH